MRKGQFGFLLIIFFSLLLVESSQSYYYPPTHIPPTPPPNYTQIGTSYFLGAPSIPQPPPDSGGIYIWYDQGMWQIANHIYSVGISHEQFHCAILAIMDQSPTLGVNVFIQEFEFWPDTTKPACLKQNDRWGWKPWGENLYEIWWDVTTREGKEGDADFNDFLKVTVVGCAVDFNIWSSGKGKAYGAQEIFLGADKTPLSTVPEYYDYFAGISDPYQSQAGSDPSNTPNITIFTRYSDTLRSYNSGGLIDSTDSYTCNLAVDYGDRYAGTFAYEGNGIQFSTECVPVDNHPPHILLPPDATFFVCVGGSLCVDLFASDPDPGDSITVEKIVGAGTYISVTDEAPISDKHCFFPDTAGSYMFVFKVTDDHGLFDIDTTIKTVDLNDPPVLTVPADFDTFLCDTATLCFEIGVTDPEGQTVVRVNPPGYYNSQDGSVCFPAYQEDDHCFGIVATDICGASDSQEVCIGVSLGDPPVVDAPDTIVVQQEQTVQDTFTASDPDGETLEDVVGITVDPDCGTYSAERIAGWGTSSGEWRLTFQATGCAVGYHTLVVEVQDSCGRTGIDTTILEIEAQPNDAPIVTVPENDTAFVDDSLTYTAHAYDPNDDILVDDANVLVVPDCGSAEGIRLTESDSSAGEWKITFYTSGCKSGSYQVIVEISDVLGATGSGTTSVELIPSTGIDEEVSQGLASFFLKQNYPNPFNLRTEISFELPYGCRTELKVYNLKGQLVKTVIDEEMDRGAYTVFWDGTDYRGNPVASGIYLYKLKTSDFTCVRKMLLLK